MFYKLGRRETGKIIRSSLSQSVTPWWKRQYQSSTTMIQYQPRTYMKTFGTCTTRPIIKLLLTWLTVSNCSCSTRRRETGIRSGQLCWVPSTNLDPTIKTYQTDKKRPSSFALCKNFLTRSPWSGILRGCQECCQRNEQNVHKPYTSNEYFQSAQPQAHSHNSNYWLLSTIIAIK